MMEHFYQEVGEDWFDYQDLYSGMVRKFPDNSVFVEVGVWKGRSASFMAVEIVNSLKKIRFFCVDTFEGSVEHSELPEIKEGRLFDIFLSNIEPVRDVVTPLKMTSLEAAFLFADHSVDFVFIDASHEYADVLEDIRAWRPKVKHGGIIAGHDYGWYGVRKAVNESFQEVSQIGSCWMMEL